MAIYHFSCKPISRSQGRSAVACAAYRSAELLVDERYDKVHDYTKKRDVAFSEILLPEGAPEWMGNREKLWNGVERVENRKDAQLAREFNFALPRELTLEQNILLAREFVMDAFVKCGMVADLCIHYDKTPSGETQPHAHVMLTLREVTAAGFGKKVRQWNAKENLIAWREQWAEVANRHLHLNGIDVRVDHRSLEAQGIDLEPQHKIGASAAKERLARFEDHQRIARGNGEKILANPHIALDAITHQQSTFTHQDIARFVNRHTVDAAQFEQVYTKVKGSDQLVFLGLGEDKVERFTTRTMLETETQMLAYGTAMQERESHLVGEGHQTAALSSRDLSDEQKLAFGHLLQPGDLTCVVGYAGTGKSYLLGACREAWERAGYQVLGATLSGIAAENLSGSSGIESRTLASRFYYWNKGEQLLTSQDILVIDEAGMIGSRQMKQVLEEAHKRKAKVVLIGDPEQLQAIEAGAAFRAMSERTGYVALTDIRRQRESWQKAATCELATGKTEEALNRYQAHHHIHAFETQASAQQGLLSLWNDVRLKQPEQAQIMLAYTRQEVRELNSLARSLRQRLGELGEDQVVSTSRGERAFAGNDRIYFLKNDRHLGVMNGTLGTVEAMQGNQMRVRLDRDERLPEQVPRVVTLNLDHYNHLDHGYAATIHKAQGVTVDRSYVLASTYLDRHGTYVAATRHRGSLDIFYSREHFANERDLVRTLSRERAKDITLDYSIHSSTFAESRGVEVAPRENQAVKRAPLFSERSLEEATRYERLLKQAAKEYDRMAHGASRFRADLSDFKAQYEASHPEQAKLLREAIRPQHERLALEAEKHILYLEKAIEQSRMPYLEREKLEQYAARIFKQKDVMGYLKQHQPKLVEKIKEWVKAHDLHLEQDRGGRSL